MKYISNFDFYIKENIDIFDDEIWNEDETFFNWKNYVNNSEFIYNKYVIKIHKNKFENFIKELRDNNVKWSSGSNLIISKDFILIDNYYYITIYKTTNNNYYIKRLISKPSAKTYKIIEYE